MHFLFRVTNPIPMKKTYTSILLLLIAIGIVTTQCTQQPPEEIVSKIAHPEWSKNASIYEVNIRQYSPEGTFNAFREDLPRLQAMGVDILWLMPIHPIGELNRKGTLGSYYAVQDFTAVNPEFGTEADFQALIDEAHELGMKVIIDWVANHSSWDNVWTANKDWYTLDDEGNFVPPVEDWADVIDFNYDNPDMRAAMLDALKYWVSEFNIDGYRCDVAGYVPTDFWVEAHTELDKIKDVFMLAEDGDSELLIEAFDMNYAWEYAHITREIAAGEQTFEDLDAMFARDAERFPKNGYRMYFTTNHDENSWNGSDVELWGPNFEAFAVLSATVAGMPLIYTGQESILDKRIEFFEKDPVDWKDYAYEDFYRLLLTIQEENEALWNGEFGGERVRHDSPEGTYAYSRKKGANEVIVAINITDETQPISVPIWSSSTYSKYGVTEGEITSETGMYDLELPPHQWFILATK